MCLITGGRYWPGKMRSGWSMVVTACTVGETCGGWAGPKVYLDVRLAGASSPTNGFAEVSVDQFGEAYISLIRICSS